MAARTIQIGDAARLADRLGIAVVADFREADVAAGGEGAPLVPLYHAALARPLAKPLAVLNLGGVGNLTWIGTDADGRTIRRSSRSIPAPATRLSTTGCARAPAAPSTTDGRLAASGRIDATRLARWLDHPYFRQPPPKSLDRDAFAATLADDRRPRRRRRRGDADRPDRGVRWPRR